MIIAAFIAAILPLALPLPAAAQIEEITVTARKKEENLKEVPVAIEAITSEDILRRGLTDISRLADQSASIKFDQGSSRQDTRLSIRGLSPTRGRQNAAILVDGIDISSEAISTSGGSILVNQRLLAVERVEIVKGPQSALWGRSAFNGAVNFVTKDPPEEFGAATSLDANVEDQYMVSGDIGGPIFGDKLGFIVNGAWWDKNGFYDNSITGDNIGQDDGYGLSLKTKSDFGNGFRIEARASYEHYEQGQSPEAYLGFNKVLNEPAGAFVPNTNTVGVLQPDGTDGQIPEGPPGLRPPSGPGDIVGDDLTSALFCLNDNLNERVPNSAIEQQLLNQTLIDRYTRISLDPNNPAIGDGPHCQHKVTVFAGEVPDGDQLQARLATNPFTPGEDYPGLDGDTVRLSLIAEWELDKGTFSSLTGYTHDDNSEQIDFSRYAVRNTANRFLDDNVNTFQSNTSKFTRQFQQDLRYQTNFDGPVNMTIGATYWEEDVTNQGRSLSMQANGSYCFYSTSGEGLNNAPGLFPFNPACPGYTELPIQQFVGPGGISFADPEESAVYNGIEKYTRDSPIDRNTDHRSIYGLIDIKATENTTVTLEGRYSHEELEVLGPVFWNSLATGGPGSWSVCGVPGRPCQAASSGLTGLDYLRRAPGTLSSTDLGGSFWNLNNFMDIYDVFQGIYRVAVQGSDATDPPTFPGFVGTKNENLFHVYDPIVSPRGVLNPLCANDPNLRAYEAAVDAEIAAAASEGRQAEDPKFDLFNPYCIGKLERTDDWFAPKVTLSHNVTPDALMYASWAHSEKPGGFALFTVGASGLREDLSAYRPEKMDTWELGAKTTLLDGTLYVESALFFNDYTDKQVLVQGLGPDGRSVSKIDNAPAEVLGLELATEWRPDATFIGGAWTVSGAYLYVDGEYKDYIDDATSENNIALSGNCDPTTLTEKIIQVDPLTGLGSATEKSRAACAISFDGNKLERAPKHSVVGAVNYTMPIGDTLEGIVEVAGQWKSKQYIEYTNESWLGAFSTFDLRAGVRSDRWEVTGYVENLFDDSSIRSASNQPGIGCCFVLGVAVDLSGDLGSTGSTAEVPSAKAAFLTPPRVVGLRANYKFGGE